MGLLSGGSLLLIPVLVISFSVAVNKSEKVKQFYESDVKEWLEWSEFLVTWTDGMSYVLAMVTFKIIKQWESVFYDCFTPLSIWLDAFYTSCMLIQLVYFIGDYSKCYPKILVESIGLGVQMSSIFCYVMLKSTVDENYKTKHANSQVIDQVILMNLSALLFFGLSVYFLIMPLDAEGGMVAPGGHGFMSIAMCVAAVAMACQLGQIFSAVYYRCKEKNFSDDSPDIARIKLGAAVVKVITQCYYCWLYTSKGYWGSYEKMPLAIMTSFALGYSAVVAFERFVGPSWLKELWDTIASKIVAGWHRVAAGYNRKMNEARQGIERTYAAFKKWWAKEREFWPWSQHLELMGRQVVAAPGTDPQRRVELPIV